MTQRTLNQMVREFEKALAPQQAAHALEFYRHIARAYRGSDEAIYAGQRIAFYYKAGA